jgi:hypothetical protein
LVLAGENPKVGFCTKHFFADAPAPWETTAGHIYVRGHGPSGRFTALILLARCGVGLMQLCVGNLKSARFISISTMTKKPRRQKTPRA